MLSNKHTILVGLVALSLLGCDSASKVESTKNSAALETAEQTLSASLIPNGHWLFNGRFCKKELPSTGVFDIKVEQSNVTHIGISQSGKWTKLPIGSHKERLKQFFSEPENSCFAPTSDFTPVVARFKAPGTDMTFLVIPGHDKLFKLQGDELMPAAHFDVTVLKQFNFIEVQSNDPYATQS